MKVFDPADEVNVVETKQYKTSNHIIEYKTGLMIELLKNEYYGLRLMNFTMIGKLL